MDEKSIRNRYRALLRAFETPLTLDDQKRVRKALNLLIRCKSGEVTITGESSIEHALSVARIIVSEIGLGATSSIGALLHDCASELPISREEVVELFGKSAAGVLDGLGKIEGIETSSSSYQAENFLKLVLSLADDIRVILIKLVERLEYMRKLEGVDIDKRLTIASESYFLYAPLAHRLGFYQVKSELEDLSMKYLDNDAYTFVSDKLKQTTASRNRFIKEFSDPLRTVLDKQSFSYTIKSRTKSIHSIWQKMKKQGVEFEEVYDLFAIRIIIDSDETREKSDCWQAYSIVADIYQPNPSRLRDWISVPKSTGYESLHTTVIGPKGKWVEVQIRSSRMNLIAEKGLAAHHMYKGVKGSGGLDKWLQQMRDVLETQQDEESSVIDKVKSGLYTDEVFIFTPTGELKRLKQGATVLDFAFEIHTQVGATCVGGKVNGKNVPIRHILANGDKVAILTSKSQKPKIDWLSFVNTSKARTRIKQALNEETLRESAEGREMLLRRLKNWKIEFNDALVRMLLERYNLHTARDLYHQIYTGKIELLAIKESIKASEQNSLQNDSQQQSGTQQPELAPFTEESEKFGDFLIIENRVAGLDYKLAKCCNPVLGDKIFGFIAIAEGVKIHRINCPNAPYMVANYPYRIVTARWTQGDESAAFQTAIKITGIDDIGMITRIHETLSSYRLTLRNFSYENKDGLFEGMIYLLVSNTNTLSGLIKKLQSIKGVIKATRHDK
jgi:GTP pyrophosphokinase